MKPAARRVLDGLERLLLGGLILLVRAYQVSLSPLLGPRCRYTPTCSQYAVDALKQHGVGRGLLLTAWRVLRCHPFARGGFDPVPPGRSGSA